MSVENEYDQFLKANEAILKSKKRCSVEQEARI
jgi:hypothetical protein